LQYWGLNSGSTPWALHQPFFYDGIFEIAQASFELRSSWVARITGVSHWLAPGYHHLFLKVLFPNTVSPPHWQIYCMWF
jgi:hypothetical protein